jgi:hypothetical protein
VNKLKFTEPVRLYLYSLLGPLVAVAVLYGVINDAQGAVWTALATAVLGVAGTEVARSKVTPSGDQ